MITRSKIASAMGLLVCLSAVSMVAAASSHMPARRPSSVAKKSSRIVNGLPADDRIALPFIVSLMDSGRHICGGSILNQRTIITAAHCLAYTRADRLKVHAGVRMRTINEGIILQAAEIYYNDQWSMDTMDYDIGLIRLGEPLIYGPNVQPVRLPEPMLLLDGTLATVAGWGFTDVWGPTTDMLQFALVPLVSQRMCSKLMENLISERMLCAGYARGGIDACQMDSGGPLVVHGNVLIGIVSWGIGCAEPGRPGVYTRVSSLLPWLRANMQARYGELI